MMLIDFLTLVLVQVPAVLFWLVVALVTGAMIFDKHDKKKTRERWEDDGK